MRDVREYQPAAHSVCSGQVLPRAYAFLETRIVVGEMAEQLAYDLVRKGLVTQRLSLSVGYDIENLEDPQRAKQYGGSVVVDAYGRPVPKPAHGVVVLDSPCASCKRFVSGLQGLFDEIVDSRLLIRRLQITAEQVLPPSQAPEEPCAVQLEMFVDYEAMERRRQEEQLAAEREKRLQAAVLSMKEKYGKNILLRGSSYQKGATARERNGQIGGHRA